MCSRAGVQPLPLWLQSQARHVPGSASCCGCGSSRGNLMPDDLLSSLEDVFPPISASRVGSPDLEGSCMQSIVIWA